MEFRYPRSSAVQPTVAAATLLALLAVLACERPGATSGGRTKDAAAPAPSATASTAATAVASVAPAAHDGTDPKRPILSPQDASFTDGRHGWGWSDRCLNEAHAAKYGWAMAACQKGLDLPDLDGTAKPALIYNQGVIAEGAGDKAGARAFYGRSLALRGRRIRTARRSWRRSFASAARRAPPTRSPGCASE